MYTIKNNVINVIEIKKSSFITLLYKVHSLDEVDEFLKDIKIKYKDASHYCYSYIINDLKKSSDDGEPVGTAGVPMIEVLNKNEMNYVLCVVVRYFGGIKLGAGGLVRSYSKSVREALKIADKILLVNGYKIRIKLNYSNIKKIDYLLKNSLILDKIFDTDIIYEAIVFNEDLDKLKEFNIELIEEVEIEKDHQ